MAASLRPADPALGADPPLGERELREISARTLAHYARRAVDFRVGTAGHDVSENIAALLRHCGGPPRWHGGLRHHGA
jgi:hypothetical protein